MLFQNLAHQPTTTLLTQQECEFEYDLADYYSLVGYAARSSAVRSVQAHSGNHLSSISSVPICSSPFLLCTFSVPLHILLIQFSKGPGGLIEGVDYMVLVERAEAVVSGPVKLPGRSKSGYRFTQKGLLHWIMLAQTPNARTIRAWFIREREIFQQRIGAQSDTIIDLKKRVHTLRAFRDSCIFHEEYVIPFLSSLLSSIPFPLLPY